MKYLLLPITMYINYLLAYYSVWLVLVAIGYIFNIGWFWLLFLGLIFLGIALFISNGLPSLIRFGLTYLYGNTWLSVILNSVAGIIGLVMAKDMFFAYEGNRFVLSVMWYVSKLKTIVLGLPFIGLIISLLWSSSFGLISAKIRGEDN